MPLPTTAADCVKCGACTVACPVYRVTGRESLTARGRLHLLTTDLAESPSSHFADLFSACLLCGRCEEVCSRGLPITTLVAECRQRFGFRAGRHWLRRSLVRRSLSHPDLLGALARTGQLLGRMPGLAAGSGLRLRLGILEDDPGRPASLPALRQPVLRPKDEHRIGYFSGCFAIHLQPSIARRAIALATRSAGGPLVMPKQQTCCGLAAWSAGRIEEAKRLAAVNIGAFSRSSGPVLVSCASCFAHLRRYGELFADDPAMQDRAERFSARVTDIMTYLVQAASLRVQQRADCRVWYHEPCHLRRFPEASRAAARLLQQTAGFSLVTPPGFSRCCGQGGLFHLGYPELSGKIFQRSLDSLLSHCPEIITTTCSGCLMQFQVELARRNLDIRVVHLLLLLADG